MKRILFIIVLGLMLQSFSNGQGCLPNGITFTTQAEIDSFSINYPGCTVIEGDVDMTWNSATNLLGLSNLISIVGDLKLNSGYLSNLSGLDSLTSIGGDLIIDASSLISLTGLEALSSIGGNLEIKQTSLVNLSGLTSLSLIGGKLYVWDNLLLTNLSGLYSLTSIVGDVEIADNDSLINLTGLDSITTLENLEIFGNQSLISLTGLESLSTITGSLIIGRYSVPFLLGNPLLADLSGLSGLTSIGGSLLVRYNFSLSNLHGLDTLTSIGGYLYIEFNNSLVNLTGLEGLTSIGGDLSIAENSLVNLLGLVGLTSIGGDFRIGYTSLVNLYGLESLTSIMGCLAIGYVSYQGIILQNPYLKDISSLSNLTSIGGDLQIIGNDSLSNLTGLDSINANSISQIIIHNNPMLSVCDVYSVCSFLDLNGNVEIHDNASGCNSEQEVKDSCEALSIDMGISQTKPTISITPNPITNKAIINFDGALSGEINIEVFSPSGKSIKSLQYARQGAGEQELVLDMGDFPAGMYFIKFQSDAGITTKKIIKVAGQ